MAVGGHRSAHEDRRQLVDEVLKDLATWIQNIKRLKSLHEGRHLPGFLVVRLPHSASCSSCPYSVPRQPSAICRVRSTATNSLPSLCSTVRVGLAPSPCSRILLTSHRPVFLGYYETSALSGLNIEAMFCDAARLVRATQLRHEQEVPIYTSTLTYAHARTHIRTYSVALAP